MTIDEIFLDDGTVFAAHRLVMGMHFLYIVNGTVTNKFITDKLQLNHVQVQLQLGVMDLCILFAILLA